MVNAITLYMNSCAAADGERLRLVIEKGQLQAKRKHEISCWTSLLAFFGFGDAAFKNVCSYIRDHRAQLKIDAKTWNTLNKVVDVYNAHHVGWKRVSELNQFSLYNFDPLDSFERERIHELPLFPVFPVAAVADPAKIVAFCRDLRHKWTEHYLWEDHEVTNLLGYLDSFMHMLQTHPDTLGASELIANALLQLRIALKLSLVHARIGPGVSNQNQRTALERKLKDMQAIVLRECFKDELAKQQKVLDAYVYALDSHYGDSVPFLRFEVERWQDRHRKAKLISIPKWYHCTPRVENVMAIFNSEIAYKQIKGYAGAFVSTKPEIESYGSWCFALSDHIETTGTHMADGTVKLPRYSQFAGKVEFAEEKKKFASFFSFANLYSWLGQFPDALIWFGFQKNIPIAQVLKREKPLEYYRDTTLAYLVYDETRHVREPLLKHFSRNQFPHLPEKIKVLTGAQERSLSAFRPSKNHPDLAKKGFDERRVRVITRSQIEQLRELFKKAKQQFTLPKEWENGLVHC